MNKSEIRFNVPNEFKTKIKIEATRQGLPLNKYIYNLIKSCVPEGVEIFTGREMMERELKDILKKLSNSAGLSKEEREKLKKRKEQLKQSLEN